MSPLYPALGQTMTSSPCLRRISAQTPLPHRHFCFCCRGRQPSHAPLTTPATPATLGAISTSTNATFPPITPITSVKPYYRDKNMEIFLPNQNSWCHFIYQLSFLHTPHLNSTDGLEPENSSPLHFFYSMFQCFFLFFFGGWAGVVVWEGGKRQMRVMVFQNRFRVHVNSRPACFRESSLDCAGRLIQSETTHCCALTQWRATVHTAQAGAETQ